MDDPLLSIRPREQVAQGPSHSIREPPPSPVLFAVMQDVTSLAERGEVPWAVVRRIVIEMGGCQNHAGRAGSGRVALGLQTPYRPSLAIAPCVPFFVPPTAVSEVLDRLAVRPAAMLAPSLGTPEPDRGRQLAPVDRIKPAMLTADRHEASRCPADGSDGALERPLTTTCHDAQV